MVKVFVYRVKIGAMTVEDVPERWREAVGKELSGNGNNENAAGD